MSKAAIQIKVFIQVQFVNMVPTSSKYAGVLTKLPAFSHCENLLQNLPSKNILFKILKLIQIASHRLAVTLPTPQTNCNCSSLVLPCVVINLGR